MKRPTAGLNLAIVVQCGELCIKYKFFRENGILIGLRYTFG